MYSNKELEEKIEGYINFKDFDFEVQKNYDFEIQIGFNAWHEPSPCVNCPNKNNKVCLCTLGNRTIY